MAANPKVKKGDPFPKALPEEIKQAALRRYALGESTHAIAESMGIGSTTVQRWAKAAGVQKGAAIKPEVSNLYETPDAMLDTFQKELKNQRIDEALGMFLKMQDGVESKYQVLMAQQLYKVFHNVMANPPPIKNWADMEKAHKMMSSILGLDKMAGGNKTPTNLNIQFEVVSEKPTTIKELKTLDAEEVSDDE